MGAQELSISRRGEAVRCALVRRKGKPRSLVINTVDPHVFLWTVEINRCTCFYNLAPVTENSGSIENGSLHICLVHGQNSKCTEVLIAVYTKPKSSIIEIYIAGYQFFDADESNGHVLRARQTTKKMLEVGRIERAWPSR